jgi:DNA-directed RNA polymerase beta subunit
LNYVIDSFEEGDTINEDTVLFHSTSYDEDMNYGYGLNVTVAYTLEPFTSEDAAIASMSIAKEFACMESDVIKIGLNNNYYLINLYGDKKHYIPLPEIGDTVSNVIAVSRRQFNNQLLYDFKDSSLKKILDGDIVFYIDKDVEVIDYVIYDNSEERNDSPFYEQINKYIDAQDEYYLQIIETCEDIMNSGYEYSREIDYLYKRAQEMVDREKKWKEGDSMFGNIEIEIHIKRKANLAKGCKFTGRFGNKSVVAKIEADENMPYTKDGRRVDVLLNLLAIINRTTSFPLFEIFINGCSYQCRQKMMTLPTLKEKADLLFDYIEVWNERQAVEFRLQYNSLKKKEMTLLSMSRSINT